MRLTMARAHRKSGERGSALILVPAGFLVLILLAGIAVDSAATYLAQRQLSDALSAAANDAAAAGIADSQFYRTGSLQIDPQRAAQTVCQAVSAQADGNLHGIRLEMAVGPSEVELRGTATVDAVFGRILPGFAHRQVSAEAAAVAAERPALQLSPLGPLSPLSC